MIASSASLPVRRNLHLIKLLIGVAVIWTGFGPLLSRADIELPSLFSDHMVLQAGMKIPVWGKAGPGEMVTISFAAQQKSTAADSRGNWRILLDPMEAATRGDMTITGPDKVVIKDVIVGEVWICSGQSNMEFSLEQAMNGDQEVDGADHRDIRLFHVKRTVSDQPADDVIAAWEPCSPDTAREFSAVGYFFGRRIHQRLDAPVGLIQATWSGSPAESWTPLETLRSDPKLSPCLHGWNDPGRERLIDWVRHVQDHNWGYRENPQMDPRNLGFQRGWARPEADLSLWQEMPLPGHWEDRGWLINGAVWFRKSIRLDESWAGKTLVLELGPIEDSDTTYFNGKKIGCHTRERPSSPNVHRRYEVPAGLVLEGANTVAVRVFNNFRKGGFSGKPDELRIVLKEGSAEGPISLQGPWKYRIESKLDPSQAIQWPSDLSFMPGGLFNGMIAPLIPFAVRGVIWYQGEANVLWAHNYQWLFPSMITAWRRRWGQGDFPFLYVQLANFTRPLERLSPSGWAELREAQLKALSLPNTGMAVAIDLGEAEDIHPKNKQDVGKRLALIARAMVHGDEIEYSGPMYRNMQVESNKIRIFFDHVGEGLAALGGGPLEGFAVAGSDRIYRRAKARIDGDSVLVWSDEVEDPCAVRYAWADNPACNLYNKSGLPSSPFRTDHWPAMTDYLGSGLAF